MNILVSVHPFASTGPDGLSVLEQSGHNLRFNPKNRRLTEADMLELAPWADAIVAGTEPITRKVIEACPNLKVISRVGSGYDSVDLEAARQYKVRVCYAPYAPVRSVIELTLGIALNIQHHISVCDRSMRAGKWVRPMGRLLSECQVGIVGTGRIGSKVLQAFTDIGCRVVAHDSKPAGDLNVEYVSKETLLRTSDLVTLHLPLSPSTYNWIDESALSMMKTDAVLINAARGQIVDESALFTALKEGSIAGAGIDVFEDEPYNGPLSDLNNVLLTSHIGAASVECRRDMEYQAAVSAVKVLRGEEPLYEVPYEIQ